MQAELNGIFTPVILGANFKSLRFATHLYAMYGVSSLVYDSRHSLLHRMCPYIECRKINYEKTDILLLDLERTARLYDATLLYLFPMSERYLDFAKENSAALEDKFVIVESHDQFTPNGAYK
jgi:hypothetical protein